MEVSGFENFVNLDSIDNNIDIKEFTQKFIKDNENYVGDENESDRSFSEDLFLSESDPESNSDTNINNNKPTDNLIGGNDSDTASDTDSASETESDKPPINPENTNGPTSNQIRRYTQNIDPNSIDGQQYRNTIEQALEQTNNIYLEKKNVVANVQVKQNKSKEKELIQEKEFYYKLEYNKTINDKCTLIKKAGHGYILKKITIPTFEDDLYKFKAIDRHLSNILNQSTYAHIPEFGIRKIVDMLESSFDGTKKIGFLGHLNFKGLKREMDYELTNIEQENIELGKKVIGTLGPLGKVLIKIGTVIGTNSLNNSGKKASTAQHDSYGYSDLYSY